MPIIISKFLKTINRAHWNRYARSFHSVTPLALQDLNREAASWLAGDVVDIGCGSGKQIPLLADKSEVNSYLGIDISKKMTKKARWMAKQFPHLTTTIINAKMENIDFGSVDSVVWINSYYACLNQDEVLSHVHKNLREGGICVIATLSKQIDMPKLLHAAKRDLISHPFWQEYCAYNLAITKDPSHCFTTLNELVARCYKHGFKIVEAHSRLYDGGLNFIVLMK